MLNKDNKTLSEIFKNKLKIANNKIKSSIQNKIATFTYEELLYFVNNNREFIIFCYGLLSAKV